MVTLNFGIDGAELVDLIRYEARKLSHKLPAGYDADDLESVGNEGATEALNRADRSNLERLKATVRLTVRNRMKDFLRSLKVPGRAAARLPADADGHALPVVDRRAADPADAAAAREVLLAPGAGRVRVPGGPPAPPDEVAAKVRALRAALFGSIRVEDVTAAMHALGRRAAKGDPAATRTLIGLIGAAPAPERVTNVIVHPADLS